MPSPNPSLYDELDPIQSPRQEVDEAATDQAIRNLVRIHVPQDAAGQGNTTDRTGERPGGRAEGRQGAAAGESAAPRADPPGPDPSGPDPSAQAPSGPARGEADPARAPDRPRRRIPISYQPQWRHSLVILALAIVIWSPLLLPSVLLLMLAVLAVTYLTLGPDRFAELCEAAFLLLQRRAPGLAERLLAARTRWTGRASALARHLPERWAESLLLPPAADDQPRHEKMNQDPFEKLAAQAQALDR